MLQKLIEFLSSYFQWLFRPKQPTEVVVIQPEPDPEDSKPQDGSDVPADSTSVEILTDIEAVEEELESPVEETPTTPPPPSPTTPTTPPPSIPTPPPTPQLASRYVWCLDNGHGKFTAGKRSPKMSNGQRLLEYEFNRDIVARIIPQLEEKGIHHYNVVPEVDVDNFLAGRVLRANNLRSSQKKIFVSIHSNAGPAPAGEWTTVDGIETWFFHGSRTGKKIAAIFQKHLIAHTDWNNRGIKSRPTSQFYVLRETSMPAILTENGFFNNKKQVYDLIKEEVRQQIADAHVAAILEIEEKGL